MFLEETFVSVELSSFYVYCVENLFWYIFLEPHMRAIEEWYIGYELDTNTTNSINIMQITNI